MINETSLNAFVKESNRIEGILREPIGLELTAHMALLEKEELSVGALVEFVGHIAPGKPIRDIVGRNVRVANHIPPSGGPAIVSELEQLLNRANKGSNPYRIHCDYETLHPFMDGNGRSGRAIWLWQMLKQTYDYPVLSRGFLHSFYYQTLSNYRA